MPITALDILPARTEVSSLSGSDTGYKAQGTSAGKNDGPSFSEMLDRAEQKDTTDGKVNVEETAMDRTSAGENENETPVEAETVEKADDVSAKTEKNTAFENQKNHAEQKTLADVAPVATQKVAAEQNSSETIIDAKSVPEDTVASSEAILPLGSDEIVPAGQEGVQFAAAAESPEKPVAENRIAQAEKTSTPQQIHEEVVSNDEAPKYVPSSNETLVSTEEQIPVKAASKAPVDAELVAETKTAENLPSETADVKKEKKSRFTEYDSIVAMLSNHGDKEAPAVMQDVLQATSDKMPAVAANADVAIPVNEKIQVVDMRTESEHFEKHVSFDEKGNAEVSISLVPTDSAVSAKEGVETGAEGLTKTDFASMLSKELETSAGDIVKTGSIVLQNNGKGSINLILHPEQLGNVKIKLELSDNQVSGKIVVASREAYDAFKENISVIKEAFSASGFETGGFELAWGGSGDGGNQSRQEDKQLAQERSINRSGSKYVDSMPDVLPEEYVGSGNINLVA